MYEQIILNCFRHLKFETLYDIEVLSLREYSLKMRAFRLARIDKEYDMHLQAWLNHQVTTTKNVGSKDKPKMEPVFKDFKSFFDYEKAVSALEGPKKSNKGSLTDKQKRMAKTAAILNKKGG